MRARNVKHFQRAFEQCDVIITPATPSAATALPAGHDTTGVSCRRKAGGKQPGFRAPVAAVLIGRPQALDDLCTDPCPLPALNCLRVTQTGVFDPSGTLETVRFTQAANMTGLPAVVLPGGRQLSGFLPVG
jgi:Asp-tRNA(Asn)/Glu-tRNA(Gln) amidotransferase A subunit family amidase